MATKQIKSQACHPARTLLNQSGLIGVVFAIGVAVNLLLLTGPFFALQVYDRVLTSRSVETLAALCVLMVVLFLAMGVLDHLRRRILARLAERFATQLEPLLPDPHRAGPPPQGTIRHLETLRQFFGSAIFVALLDLPWFPVFALVLWVFHPVLAMLAIGGAAFYLLIGGLRLIVAAPHSSVGKAEQWAACVLDDPDLMATMGGHETCANKWRKLSFRARSAALKKADRQAMLASVAQTARLILQSLIVALAAYLVIQGQLSPGAIIACSVLLARAFGPLDVLVQSAPHIRAAFMAWHQISQHAGNENPPLPLPIQCKEHGLEVFQVTVFPPSSRQAALRLVDFQIRPGQVLSVHGPSGSGKTMLARVLAGSTPVAGGHVRIGGTPPCRLMQADGEIGYLPQKPRLAPMSIAQNIGGPFADTRNPETMHQIMRAARFAGADTRILALGAGYETIARPGPIPPGLIRQIALARAICHDPWLLLLDEPTAELDEPATAALSKYIHGHRANGGMVVMFSQYPDPLDLADLRLHLNAGLSQGLVPRARHRAPSLQGQGIGGAR